MSPEDELKLNNNQIIIDSASEERLAKHRRICQEHGLVVDRESNLRSVTAVRKYVSNQLVELINDAGIRTAKPPYDEFKTVPKGFMPGPELWVRNHGKTLVGWPEGLKEKSVETWHMNHTYAVAYLLIRNRIYIDSPEMRAPSYPFKNAKAEGGSGKKKQMKLEVLITRRPKTAASARSTATNSTTVAGSSKGKEKEIVIEEGSDPSKHHPTSPKKKKLPKSTELIESDEETLAEEEATSSVITPTKPSSAVSHQLRKSRDRDQLSAQGGIDTVSMTGNDEGGTSPMIEHGISPSLAQVPLHFGEDTLSRGVGFMEGISWDEGHGFADDEDDEEEEEEEKEDDDSSGDEEEENDEPQATQSPIESRAMFQMDIEELAPRIVQSDGAILLSPGNGSHQEKEDQDMASVMKADAEKTATHLESDGPSSSSEEEDEDEDEDEEAEAEEAEERGKEEEEEEDSVIEDNKEKIAARAESSDSSSAPEREDEELLTIKITPRARSNSSSSSDDDEEEAPLTKEEEDPTRESSTSSSESSSSTDEESEEGEPPIAKGEPEVISEHSESDTTSSSSESGEEESESENQEEEEEEEDPKVSLEPPVAKAAEDIVSPQAKSTPVPLSRNSAKSGDQDESGGKDGHKEEETSAQAPLASDDNPVAQLPMTMPKHPEGVAGEESSDSDTEEDDEEEESDEDDTDMKEAQVAQEKNIEEIEDLSAPGMTTPKADEPSHKEKEAREPLQSSLPQSLSSSSYPSLPPPAQPPRQSESSEDEDSHDEDDEVEGEVSNTSRSSTPAHDDNGDDHLSLPPPGQPPQLVETSDETSDSESESMSEVGVVDESREAKRKLAGDGEESSPRKKQRTVDTDPDRDGETEQDRESHVIIGISQVQSGGGPQTITRKPPDSIPKWRERAGIEASSPLEDLITKVSPVRTYQPHPLLQKKWKGVPPWNGESPPRNKAGFGGVKKRKMSNADASEDGPNSGASKLVVVPPSDAGERIELERERERRTPATPVTKPRSQKLVDATYTSPPLQSALLSPPKLNKGQQNATHHRKAARRWPRGGKVK